MFAPSAGGPRPAQDVALTELNRRLRRYPSNHIYRVRGGQMLPSRQLRDRWRLLEAAYPSRLESFLDVGSCKGYFVLRQAQRPQCLRAVGIDVDADFVEVSQRAAAAVGAANVRFEVAGIDDVARDPAAWGGPFQVVQLISTYHYLFWGSEPSYPVYPDHRAILGRLAAVCSRHLVFANPLTVEDAPSVIRRRARGHSDQGYTREAFMEAAEELFDVFQIGYLDRRRRRPILLMVKREARAS